MLKKDALKVLFAAFVLVMADISLANDMPAPMIKYPCAQGQNLSGQEFNLPEDFTSEYTIAIHAFERKQQADVDTWFPYLDKIEANHKNVKYYELPTIDRMNMFMRWWIDSGMRRGIPDESQRDRTITLYLEDKEGFLDSMGITDQSIIYVVLLDSKGRILHMESGLASEEKIDRIKNVIKKG